MLEINFNKEKGKVKKLNHYYNTTVLASLPEYWNKLTFVYSYQCSVSTSVNMFIILNKEKIVVL